MTRTTVAFLAAGAAVLLASCATAPRTPSLTIELFDSRAAVVSAQRARAPQPAMPLPEAPGAAAAGPAAARVPDLPARAQPAVGATFDTGLTFPVRPRAKASFVLAVPPAPAAGAMAAAGAAGPAAGVAAPAAISPASARDVPQLAGKAPSSAGISNASKAAPTPRPASPVPAAPAAAALGPAPGAAAAGAPSAGGVAVAGNSVRPAAETPASSYGRLREIYARQGDVLQVGLDGVGFLFLGFADTMTPGMTFKSKENRNNKTWFTFQALKMGTYDLDFLKQDNSAGRSLKETVRVHVVSDLDFNAAVAQPQAPDPLGRGTEESADPAFAQKLSSLGAYQAAVVELLKGYKDGNPVLNDQIAALYMRMGSYDAAGKYYVKNLNPQNGFTSNAVVGLVRIAVLQNDQQALLSSLRRFLLLQDSAMEEPLIQAVRMEKARSEFGMALDLAGEYVRRFPDGQWRDEADYLSAQLLEADSQFRDIARARMQYMGILSSRPESAFADSARQRLHYIDRHFYQVR